jgi:hypothetical protein
MVVGKHNGSIVAGVSLVALIAGGFERAEAQSLVRPIPRAEPLSGPLGPVAGFRELAGLEAAPVEEWITEARLFGEARPSGELEGLDSAVETQRMGWSAAVIRQIDERERLTLEGELESSFYGWSGSAPLVGGSSDPFNDLYRARFAASHLQPLSERLSVLNGLEFSLNGEDEADLLEGLVVGGSSALGFAAHEQLEIRAGALVFSRLEDDPLAIPFLGIDWRPSEALHLSAEGPRVRLDLALSERLSLRFESLYAQRQYRLNDTGGAAPVFRDEAIDLKGELHFAANQYARLVLSAGLAAWREFTFLSDGGEKLLEAEQSKEPFVGLALHLSF